MNQITPFLWFDHQAIEAADFYVSIFKNSRLLEDSNDGEISLDEERSSVAFELNGQHFIAFNGGPFFQFTPAISFFVECETQDEIDFYWEKLTQGGEAGQCGWLKDKYGISWQIIPKILPQLLNHPDSIKAQKAMECMLQMKKLNIQQLQASTK